MSDGELVRLEGVRKAYGRGANRREVLAGVDLCVRAGELVAVIGPSGAGKSTLLNLIAGLDRADAGRVRLLGEDLGDLTDRALSSLRNRAVGFVFQAFHLLEHLTVAENVSLPAYFAADDLGLPARRARALEVLDRVGLRGLEDRPPAVLSGGQRQRVAIARALFGRPRLVLADEPTGNLDTRTGAEVLDLFDGLHRDEQTAFVIVTHEQSVCARAERTLRLDDGRVAE